MVVVNRLNRLLRHAERRLLREPRRGDDLWVLILLGTLLLLVTIKGLFSSLYSAATVFVLFASGLGMIATGIAESLPARRHTSTVILRVVALLLGIAAVPALVLALINP